MICMVGAVGFRNGNEREIRGNRGEGLLVLIDGEVKSQHIVGLKW